MPKEESVTIHCISPCLDGKGGMHKPGDKVTFDPRQKDQAAKLLATRRFVKTGEEAKAAVERAAALRKARQKKPATA